MSILICVSAIWPAFWYEFELLTDTRLSYLTLTSTIQPWELKVHLCVCVCVLGGVCVRALPTGGAPSGTSFWHIICLCTGESCDGQGAIWFFLFLPVPGVQILMLSWDDDQVSLICNTVTMEELITAGDIDSDGTDTIELCIITRNDSRWDLLLAGKRAMLTGLEKERERERQNTLNPNPEKEREWEREHICISHSFSLFLTTYTPHTHTTHTRPPAVLATRWPGRTWRFIPAIFLCNA